MKPETDVQMLRRLLIQNLQDQTVKYVERIINQYVSGLNTREETVRFFKCEMMELSDNIGRL